MSDASAAGESLHISSSHFSRKDQVDIFLDHYGRALMQCDIDPAPGHPFQYEFTVRAIDKLGIADGRFTPAACAHRADMIDNDDILLICAGRGRNVVNMLGKEVLIHDGEAVLVTNGEVGVSTALDPVRMTNFRFSRAQLAALGGDLDGALMRRIDRTDPILGLLRGYANALGPRTPVEPMLGGIISQHFHDLATLLLGPSRDGIEIASRRGVRAARWRAVEADIATHLTDRDLSIAAVCARVKISPRMLRALFNGEGTTFADYVLTRRLARMRERLADPRWNHETISALAYDTGFGDLSHFNHAFRRHFGATPSDIRFGGRSGR